MRTIKFQHQHKNWHSYAILELLLLQILLGSTPHKPRWLVTQLLQTWSVQDFTLATQLKPYLQNSTAVTGQVETM